MEQVVRSALQQLDGGRRVVVATIVRTSGSTPQKPGARLLLADDGTTVGTLGGGCVEADICATAGALLDRAGGARTGCYEFSEDLTVRDGLICGGQMTVLLDPVHLTPEFRPFARAAIAALEGGSPVVIGTLIATPEGSPLRVGAKVLVRENGEHEGSLGSGDLDLDAIGRAARLLESAGAREQELVEAADGVEYFLEAWTTPPTLIIAGGGHVGRAIEPIARGVGFRTVVIDDRPEYANRERFPDAHEVVAGEFGAALADMPTGAGTFIVVATRGHEHDDTALEAACRSRAGYVALLGSKRKTLLILEALAGRGIPIERLREVRGPVGLDIGARTPEEIAIAIVAEMIMVRRGGTGAR